MNHKTAMIEAVWGIKRGCLKSEAASFLFKAISVT